MSVHTLMYPEHLVKPEDLLNFIEMDWFENHWKNLGLDDEALTALQILIMCNPKAGPVIPGTSGLRKLRFSPPEWKRGKRGALRICYLYFEKYGMVILLEVYDKSEKDDLSPKGMASVNRLVGEIKKGLEVKFGF